MWTAGDDDPSAYLGNSPRQCSADTKYHVPFIGSNRERFYAKSADYDVARSLLAKMQRDCVSITAQ